MKQSNLPITKQVIDHLKSLGFEARSPVRPGEYFYQFNYTPSEDAKKLGISVRPNRAGNVGLFCVHFPGTRRLREPAAFASFGIDEVLSDSFEKRLRHLEARAIEAANFEVARENAQARRDASQRQQQAALVTELRLLDLRVDEGRGRYWSSFKVNGLETDVCFDVNVSTDEVRAYLKISGITVGKTCAGDIDHVARRAKQLIDAIEGAA